MRLKMRWSLGWPQNALRRLWSDCAYAQADLSLRWAHMPSCRYCCALAHVMNDLKCIMVLFSGKIGINLAASWYQPKATEPEVSDAIERAFQFELGWFAEPILLTGDYPGVMKQQIARKSKAQGVSNRLPVFNETQKRTIKGTLAPRIIQ